MNTTLDKAATLIEAVGWCQHITMTRDNYGTPTAYCAISAIQASAVNDNTLKHAINRLSRYLSQLKVTALIANWNDDRSNTKQNVINTLRKAARYKGKLN